MILSGAAPESPGTRCEIVISINRGIAEYYDARKVIYLKKWSRVLIAFPVSFIIGYLLIGYIRYSRLVFCDDMGENIVLVGMRQAYILDFPVNILPAAIVAVIVSVIVCLIPSKRSRTL